MTGDALGELVEATPAFRRDLDLDQGPDDVPSQLLLVQDRPVSQQDAGIGELVVCNRTPERADELADALQEPERAHTRYWQDLPELGHFDLILNATSAGRGTQPLQLPFRLTGAHTVAVDLSYGMAAIDFLAWAKAAGCGEAFDGLGMLVEQAAESFRIWQGVRPDTDGVYAELRRLADGEGAAE